jgi:hypothetical protein
MKLPSSHPNEWLPRRALELHWLSDLEYLAKKHYAVDLLEELPNMDLVACWDAYCCLWDREQR